MATVNEVNSDKTRIRDEFNSRNVSLVGFPAELNVYLIQNKCTPKILTKSTAAYV